MDCYLHQLYSYHNNYLETGGWFEQKDLEIYIVGKPYKSIVIDGQQEYHRDIILKENELTIIQRESKIYKCPM